MFVKTKAVVLVLMIMFTGLNAGSYTVPNGFSLIKNSYGAKLYRNYYAHMYAVVVDMDKATINFDTLENSYGDKYEKYTMQKWWNDYSDYRTFAIVNGQFFNHLQNPSKLAFPLKSNWNIITSHVDDNLAKRTLIINNDGTTYIKNGYSSYYLNNTKNVIVGLNPSVDKGGFLKSLAPIGRNYIGGISKGNCNPNIATCSYKYLIFFIGEKHSQPNFLSRIRQWGVSDKSIVMMDGSASSQLISGNIKVYGYKIPGSNSGRKRPVPHVITINKW